MTSLTARRRARHTTRGQSALLERVADTASRALRVAFYARVSTEEQADKQTPRNQIEYMERRYTANFAPDADDPWQLVGTFIDEGISGTVPFPDRPRGGELLKLARAKGVDLIVFVRLDRFGRRVTVIYDAFEQLEKLGVMIQSATEPWETRTPVGKMIFGLMAVLAEFERELIKDRFVQGRDRHARADEFINGVVPFGYEVVDGKLAPSHKFIAQAQMTEADLAREMFRRVADGDTVKSVSDWLNALGVPSTKVWAKKKTGERTTHDYGDVWWAVRLSRMFRATLYYGHRVLKYKNGAIEQQVAPLVSYELWLRANESMDDRIRKGWHAKHLQQGKYPYLLSGRLFCASCDLAMQGNKQRMTKDGKIHTYYICARASGLRESKRSGPCEGWSYANGTLLEQWAIDDIDAFMADPAAATQRLREAVLERQGETVQHDTVADQLRLRLAELEASKARVIRLVRLDRITEQEAEREFEAINAEAAGVRQQLDRTETKLTLAESMERRLVEVTTALQALRDGWHTARTTNDRTKMQEIISRLLGSAEIFADGRVKFHWLVAAPGEAAGEHSYSSEYPASSAAFDLTIPRILIRSERRRPPQEAA